MAAVAGKDGSKGTTMADDEPTERDDEASAPRPNKPTPRKSSALSREGGFFTIYKSGQGYWTRVITVMGALLLGALLSQFIYMQMFIDGVSRKTSIIVAICIFIAWCVLTQWITNKPQNADFLIATDSEMKKVNWTSRKELVGSTKVVIGFMFLMAVLLFVVDLVFHTLFWSIGVLHSRPPFIGDWFK